MTVARAARAGEAGNPAWLLYERIGTFLHDQRLEPDPANFAFAWHLLHDSDGPLARAVAALTDGGVRLTKRDIESLGVDSPASARSMHEKADGLVAQTQMQVEGFQDMVQSMRDETVGFGRDLARSADTIRRFGRSSTGAMLDELTRVTAAMLERVHSAESRLENATREAIELRDKLEEARDNARRDPLTGLPNRRAFEEAYAELAAAGGGMCVAVCDVDHFKTVNDRFGHAVGDRVLKTIAGTLQASCAGHLVARYGGEEFVVLLAVADLEAARVTLDNARAAVAAKRYRLRETDAPLGEITFSAGLTRVAEGESIGTSIGRADRLLYSAKNDGRNCVRVT